MRLAHAVALAGLLAACNGPAPRSLHGHNQDQTMVERGRYLAAVGDCTACHTEPGGQFLAGGRTIGTPLGSIVSPNITPDKDTGIGAMSDEQFYNAMHTGVSDKHLYPVMPYPYYTKVTREDVTAIRAWLDTVPPVVNRVHADTLPFPLNIRAGLIGWNALYFTAGEWQNRPDKSAEWNRGGYIVEGLGHCGACHTPKNFLAGDENSRRLQGYALQGWFAPEITSDQHVGLGSWPVDDIVEYLRTGTNRFTSASGPMGEEISNSSSQWTMEDLRAAATYLKDQPGSNQSPPQPLAAQDPTMQAGAAIYTDECSACHDMGGAGIARLMPALQGSPFVQQREPTTLLRVVLGGTRAVATDFAPTGPAMPAMGWKLSDEQVAAVVSYIRNAWGNAAPAVSARDVRRVRTAFADERE